MNNPMGTNYLVKGPR